MNNGILCRGIEDDDVSLFICSFSPDEDDISFIEPVSEWKVLKVGSGNSLRFVPCGVVFPPVIESRVVIHGAGFDNDKGQRSSGDQRSDGEEDPFNSYDNQDDGDNPRLPSVFFEEFPSF